MLGRRGSLELCHEELILLVEHIDEVLLFLLLLFYALEGVPEGITGIALLFVGVIVVLLGGFLEVVGFANDFEGLGGEFFIVEFEVYAEQRVLILTCEYVDTCFDGD